jgi:hypothetical protein
MINTHQRKGGRTISRIDLDDHEWNLLQTANGLVKDGILELDQARGKYHYRGIEIVKR